MRRALLIAGFAASSVFAAAAPSTASAASDVFRGSWASVDPGDGSAQTLRIEGAGLSGRHSVFLHDTVASQACAGGPANVIGMGTVSDSTLYWSFTVTCPGGGRPPFNGRVGPGFFSYDAGTDTLTDDAGAVWSRVS